MLLPLPALLRNAVLAAASRTSGAIVAEGSFFWSFSSAFCFCCPAASRAVASNAGKTTTDRGQVRFICNRNNFNKFGPRGDAKNQGRKMTCSGIVGQKDVAGWRIPGHTNQREVLCFQKSSFLASFGSWNNDASGSARVMF